MDQLAEYGAEPINCPDQLRSMVDEIIPEALKTELLDHDDVITWQDVIAFCKKRTYHLKAKSLAKAAAKGKVHALAARKDVSEIPVPTEGDTELEPPAWAKPLIAALAKPPAPHPEGRPPRGDRGRSPARTPPGSRNNSNGSNRDSSYRRAQRKFIFRGGCNHCGAEGHQRKDCAEFLAIKKKHNGELPPGCKGAREKAFDEWYTESKPKGSGKGKDKKAKGSGKGKDNVRALTVQPDSSDSDWTDDEGTPGIMACMTENKWEPVVRGTPIEHAVKPRL